MLEHVIELCLPTIISACELMGIFVVAVTALHAFWLYCLATSLEFKMAAEILKTVLVRTLNELMVLGAVILLRALLSLLIHIEMKGERQERLSKEQED